MWNTGHPKVSRWSVMIRRWHHYYTASAHIMPVMFLPPRSRSLAKLERNVSLKA